MNTADQRAREPAKAAVAIKVRGTGRVLRPRVKPPEREPLAHGLPPLEPHEVRDCLKAWGEAKAANLIDVVMSGGSGISTVVRIADPAGTAHGTAPGMLTGPESAVSKAERLGRYVHMVDTAVGKLLDYPRRALEVYYVENRGRAGGDQVVGDKCGCSSREAADQRRAGEQAVRAHLNALRSVRGSQ